MTRTPPSAFSYLFLLAISAGALSCEQGGVTVNLFAYDQSSDEYRFQNVEIETLADVARLEGDATVVKGGARLIINYEKNYLKWKKTPHSVAFNAFETSDGVLVPEDYDSLAMVSIYSNVEKSVTFFERIGIPSNVVGNLPVYYLADITFVETDGTEYQMRDNAFYMPISGTEKGFFIAPFDQFQWVPMSLNSGIITHEYTHAVFDAIVGNPPRSVDLTDAASNFLYGVNEGCADYMAVARTGDPDFMRHSIPEGYFGGYCNGSDVVPVDRDAAWPVYYGEAMDKAAREIAPSEFCPYEIGSFLASLLYAVAQAVDDMGGDGEIPSKQARYDVARWFIAALGDFGANPTGNFELWDMLSLFVFRINNAEARDEACTIIGQRYNIYFNQVDGC